MRIYLAILFNAYFTIPSTRSTALQTRGFDPFSGTDPARNGQSGSNSYTNTVGIATSRRVIGYYLHSHSQYEQFSSLTWNLFTDMVYYGARPMENYQFTFGTAAESSAATLGMQYFVQRAKAFGVTPFFAIGGEQGSAYFSYYLRTYTNRQQFAQSLVALAMQYNFDGVAIDWQSPNSNGPGCNWKDSNDVTYLGYFVQELKSQWPQGRIIVRSTMNAFYGASGAYATSSEMQMLVNWVDYIDIKAYDVFTGNLGMQAGPLSPMTSQCASSQATNRNGIQEALQLLLAMGFPTQKIILGFAGYSRAFYLTQGFNSQLGLYQVHRGSAPQGGWTDTSKGSPNICGVMRGWEGTVLVSELISNGWLSSDGMTGFKGYQRGYDQCAQQAYLYNQQYLLVYDDMTSLQAKSSFAFQKGLAGLSFFDTMGHPKQNVQAACNIWGNSQRTG